MATETASREELLDAFANAPALDSWADAVDVRRAIPLIPPASVQQLVVGSSFHAAYNEAGSFVRAATEAMVKAGGPSLAEAGEVLDFGCGWGRISRVLLTQVQRSHLVGVDVEPGMVSLVNQTLPGLSVLNVDPVPPTVLGNERFGAVMAFSVFSHLSEASHRAWASELGRVTQPGGFAAITVLDEILFGKVRGAQSAVASGNADEFARGFSRLLGDVGAEENRFAHGELVYSGVGGGGVLSGDFYGWAAAPQEYVKRVWGDAGFDIVQWVRSQVLFDQALVVLRRRDTGAAPRHVPEKRRGLGFRR